MAVSNEKQLDVHLTALSFLHRNGPHCIGPLDNDDKLAAAITMRELIDEALVMAVINDGETEPVYHLTTKGRARVVDAKATAEKDEPR